jgi:hypothetical protein
MPEREKTTRVRRNCTMRGFMICTPSKILFTSPNQEGWDWLGVWYCERGRRDMHTGFGSKSSKKDTTGKNLAFIGG